MSGEMLRKPPRCGSRIAAKTLGESKLGKQRKSMLPSTLTSAMERIFPITP